MDQFTVPQFIDVEDKVFGPVTTRQFIILLIGGLLVFICYKLADLALFALLFAVIGGFTLILAFVKINGQAFHYFMLNSIQTKLRPKRRVWYKQNTTFELKEIMKDEQVPEKEEAVMPVKHVSTSKIRNLSLQVNTGGYYKGE